MVFYHNPRCRKSREALELLDKNQVHPTIIEYLKAPLTVEELSQLSDKLGRHPLEWIRKGEEDYKTHFRGKELSKKEWFEAIAKYPKLMERPILVNGNKAVVGRPPSDILSII